MAALPWREEYRINVSKIDDQHRELADRVAQLHMVLDSDKGYSDIEQVLDELISFTHLHFTTEEQLMIKHEYPEYPAHKKAHQLLLNQMLTLADRLSENHAVGFAGADDISGDWVVNHLLEKDVPLGKFLNEKGVT